MMEKDLSRLLLKNMRQHGHFERIENMTGVGMPDVSYAISGEEGFIENKWRAAWPRDPEDVVTLDHYTNQQRIWARQRTAAGGRVYLLLEIERPSPSYFLLSGIWCATYLGKTATRADIEANALVIGLGKFPTLALAVALRTRRIRG
jgi:hypothetical protein